MRDKRFVTLKDIAEKCHVSVSAVSKILSGEENFKEETIQLVQKTAKELGYTPNVFARSMKGKSASRTVGFFVPNIMNPFFSELVNQVEKKLSRHSYNLMLCLFDDNAQKMSEFLRMLVETRAAGCIISSCREDKCQPEFDAARKVMGMVSIQGDVKGVDRVDVTDEEGTYEMIRYLIQKGHRKIAFLGYRYDISILQHRLDGFYKAMGEDGIKVPEEYVVESKHTSLDGYISTRALLELPDPPTAIHCINEFMAVNAYQAVRDLGLRIPEDVSITGFDGLSFSRVLSPSLTTIEDPVDLLAGIAVDMLIERIEKNEQNDTTESEPKQVYVRHRFLERESVATLPRKRKTAK